MSLSIIVAPDGLTVRSIAPFADEVRAALAGTDDVVLDLSAVEAPDLSVIQLVEAARRQATRDGATLMLAHRAAGPLAALLDRVGLGELASTDAQFWFQGASPR